VTAIASAPTSADLSSTMELPPPRSRILTRAAKAVF
jgi:hypothetical protein